MIEWLVLSILRCHQHRRYILFTPIMFTFIAPSQHRAAVSRHESVGSRAAASRAAAPGRHDGLVELLLHVQQLALGRSDFSLQRNSFLDAVFVIGVESMQSAL